VAGPIDVCLARAFRDAIGSWEVAERVLPPGGSLIYFAGARFDVADLPPGVAATWTAASSLANAGPLVIMTRQ
jgi:hypothetical protein